ncbi:Uu.00g016760.m01.CDS01 [Anthostomella pinea]|uniref:Uu.00g016760.m01.CDS01 n=1 Tax=Anthostomella pinea TaxID=933095 RepID=A0AAI8VYT1_9PEZI|nr:Uu.00g016760.m01.CDS01 [Anthostomella pinea]
MVSSSFFGGLAARAFFLMSSHTHFADQPTYTANTIDAIKALQTWYDNTTGLWDTTGWWNSANCLTTLADFAVLNPTSSTDLDIPNTIQNTYEQAQKTAVSAVKSLSVAGLPISTYTRISKRALSKRGFENFLNDYYDDEGWWALAMIRSHDVGVYGMGDQQYLQAAEEIFEDMHAGNSSCGGIYWSKVGTYTNAIANELFLSVAASLANRVPGKKDYYLAIAQTQWNWFKNSGLINSDNLINDGLTDDCKNNGMTTWTYNQGVILGGLVELYKASGDASLLNQASTIAGAAISTLSRNGVLYEGCEPNCGSDGAQFKGVFMRNLRYLQQEQPQQVFASFILANADAIWANDRNKANNQLGPTWNGPLAIATAGTQSSALDTLVGAVAVS